MDKSTTNTTATDNCKDNSIALPAAVDNIAVQPSTSYNTSQSESCNQSVQTHGTHSSQQQHQPNSPIRAPVTPQSLSPSSIKNTHSNTTAPQQVAHLDVIGAEVIPSYGGLQQQQDAHLWLGIREDEWAVSLNQQQHQQQGGHRNIYQLNRQRSNPASDDDEVTEPSSLENTTENTTLNTATTGTGYTKSDISKVGATSTFGRLIETAAKTINNRNNSITNPARKESADEEGVVDGAFIYGYLRKLNRNGKWQTRWFETDGECLTYYKSSKRTKLLASLDLAKVGSIAINHQDETGCGFIINILKRPYDLRADSKTAMKDWVITLNRVKEARMEEGNVKLATPENVDLLDVNFTPRVVVVANRKRTHAVEDDDDFHNWEMKGQDGNKTHPYRDVNSLSTAETAPNARWKKANTSLSQIASKILRWARNIRQFGCADDAANQVMVMDHTRYHSNNAATNTPNSILQPRAHSSNNRVMAADFLDSGNNGPINKSGRKVPSNRTSLNHQTASKDSIEDDFDDDVRFLS